MDGSAHFYPIGAIEFKGPRVLEHLGPLKYFETIRSGQLGTFQGRVHNSVLKGKLKLRSGKYSFWFNTDFHVDEKLKV